MVASSGVGSELRAEAMLTGTTPGWIVCEPTCSGAEPAVCACAIDRLLGRGRRDRPVVGVTAPPPAPPPRPAAASCAWRISWAQLEYSSVPALSSFSASLYAFWLNPLSDSPWVQRSMIFSATFACAVAADDASATRTAGRPARVRRRRGRSLMAEPGDGSRCGPKTTNAPGRARPLPALGRIPRPRRRGCRRSRLRAPAAPSRARSSRSRARPDHRARERIAVARRHDQAVAPVAHQPAGGRADGVAGDHRQTPVHRLVDDQTPRLAERTRRGSRAPPGCRRRHTSRAIARRERVDAAHARRIGLPGRPGPPARAPLPGHVRNRGRHAAGWDPRGAGSHADEDERGDRRPRSDICQASISARSPFSRSGRPANMNLTPACPRPPRVAPGAPCRSRRARRRCRPPGGRRARCARLAPARRR